eukprot:220600_1
MLSIWCYKCEVFLYETDQHHSSKKKKKLDKIRSEVYLCLQRGTKDRQDATSHKHGQNKDKTRVPIKKLINANKRAFALIMLLLQKRNTAQLFVLKCRRKKYIRYVRQQVYRKYMNVNESKHNLVLTFHGDQLKDGKTLHDYNVNDGDIIVWHTDIDIKLQERNGTESFILKKCKRTNHIHNVRQQVHMFIKNKSNIPAHFSKQDLALTHNGIRLMDNKTLRDYNVSNEAIIEWHIDQPMAKSLKAKPLKETTLDLRVKRFPRSANEKIRNKYCAGEWLEVQDTQTLQWLTATVTDKENNWIC